MTGQDLGGLEWFSVICQAFVYEDTTPMWARLVYRITPILCMLGILW